MVDLDYYHPWYHDSLQWHKALGVIIMTIMLLRFIWNRLQAKPKPLQTDHLLQNRLATLGHWSLYLLIFALGISGYLISTAKGQGIDIFSFFELPALLPDNAERGELAGKIHEVIAISFIGLVIIHALAAFIHHFYYKDNTLKRMLGRTS
ncbi:MAG: Cytochrome b [uncultured Thiotrichaceae bacterium]|uniref:Cytochrome b n=1 Tax=uncultured Thiotrichaceae bacterium TaxID=298394 RepID=A0A6S6U9R1_9GAMM|nr:MAG: Cytochrome b [uncultured Thiotrichaceae bacterium]